MKPVEDTDALLIKMKTEEDQLNRDEKEVPSPTLETNLRCGRSCLANNEKQTSLWLITTLAYK